MFDLLTHYPADKSTNHQGMIELDFDAAADRYAILDRRSLIRLFTNIPPLVNPAKIIVPFRYTTNNDLVVMIFDDSGSPSYNMVGNDKVQAQLVDARTVTTNP